MAAEEDKERQRETYGLLLILLWGRPCVSFIYKYIPLDAGERNFGHEAKTTK